MAEHSEAIAALAVYKKQLEGLVKVQEALTSISNVEGEVRDADKIIAKSLAAKQAAMEAKTAVDQQIAEAQATLSDVKKQAAQHQREAMDNAGKIRDLARADAKTIVEKAVEAANSAVVKAKGEVDVATVKLTDMNNQMKAAEGLRDQFKKELNDMKARLM